MQSREKPRTFFIRPLLRDDVKKNKEGQSTATNADYTELNVGVPKSWSLTGVTFSTAPSVWFSTDLCWKGEFGGFSFAGGVDGSQWRRPGVGHLLKHNQKESYEQNKSDFNFNNLDSLHFQFIVHPSLSFVFKSWFPKCATKILHVNLNVKLLPMRRESYDIITSSKA